MLDEKQFVLFVRILMHVVHSVTA